MKPRAVTKGRFSVEADAIAHDPTGPGFRMAADGVVSIDGFLVWLLHGAACGPADVKRVAGTLAQ
jgi:hypothetical protein